jgi:hypothetical protein
MTCGGMVSSVWREVFSMRKSIFVIAVAAAACSGVALAGEVKQDKAQVVKATTMSDAQMDKVTAGDPGKGNGWAWGTKTDGPAWKVFNTVPAFPGHNK